MGCGWPGGEQIHSQEFTKVKIRKKFIVTRRNKIKENIVFIEANMTRNSHIFSQLDFFSAKRNPGYALLVNAPWGSGKSFLLRKWMGPRKDCLYVSLYGLVDSKGIEDEIFNSLLTMKGSLKPPKGSFNISRIKQEVGWYFDQPNRRIPTTSIESIYPVFSFSMISRGQK